MIVAGIAIVGLIALVIAQAVLHSRERQTLLDRIQAPELVIEKRTPLELSDEPLFVEVEDPESVKDYELAQKAGRTT